MIFSLQVGQKKTITLNGQKAIEALQMNIPDLDYSWSKFYKDNGVFHKGTSRFNMKINGDADEIVLVKRSNKTYHAITKFTKLIEQARLYVDNSNIGIWENSNYRAHRYWQNDTIHIPKNSYVGKSQVNLRLQYLKGEPWSEYYYWIVCDGVVTDSIDVGNAESEQAHNYTASSVQNIPYNEINNRYDAPKAIKKHNRQILDSLYIHIYFDGENQPSVSTPIGLFFGTGVNDAAYMKAIPTGNINGWYYNYFTMPFWKNARIELENKSHRDLNRLTLLLASTPHQYDKREVGYFKTFYNKDSKAATDSTDYLVAKIEGRGVLVGTVMEVNQNDNTITCWLEGDEHIYIDNSLTPQFIGTGTEDYFNSTFYFYFDEY
ncbi:MAG: DUF2961 domain-containing protein, partial [Chitinophagales bacterium]|nr:DUF2961 domain-containing protein [Chitinophagales bacterium]